MLKIFRAASVRSEVDFLRSCLLCNLALDFLMKFEEKINLKEIILKKL